MEYFCLQYDEKKKRLSRYKFMTYGDLAQIKHGELSEKLNREISIKKLSSRLERDISMIEAAAEMAGGNMKDSIMQNVCYGVPYEKINVFLGRRQFYAARKKFFERLYKMKNDMEAEACM